MTVMLLAGVAIMALSGAVIGLLSYLADDQMLRDLSLWQMGTLAILLGPNGAGKSTLLKCLTGELLHEGTITLFGLERHLWDRIAASLPTGSGCYRRARHSTSTFSVKRWWPWDACPHSEPARRK